jgi:Transposase DDE domain
MSEAKQRYDGILAALSPLLPRTAYQDVRRVPTLAWAITGLCLLHSVRLSAWAEVAQSRSQNAARRVRRFSRWLHHSAIVPAHWYRPVIQAALSGWPVDQRLSLALDTTALTPFVLIRACLVYRGRAIPLAWPVMRHRSTQVSFEAYQPVLDQVCAILPAGDRITLLADRGFVHERLLHYLYQHHWHFRLRLPANTLVHLGDQPVSAVRDLCPPAGESRFFQEAAVLGTAVGPVSLALTRLLEQPDDPWFIVSDEQASARTLDEYGLRFDIEETFRDEKSGGYQLQTSRLATPDALERLLLILALTTLYLTSLGTEVVQADKWRWVDPHWGRGLSYFQLGWRWRRQQTQRGWQAFAPFRLDPAPDPLPLLAPRRVGSRESSEGDLLAAA